METREIIVTNYFKSWLTKDASVLEKTFAIDAVYIESWGPAYKSLHHIQKWFTKWNKHNVVLQWSIKRFFHQGNVCVCEWYFQCDCRGKVSDFDGVSLIEFDKNNKISMLKEFQSKIPNRYPYE